MIWPNLYIVSVICILLQVLITHFDNTSNCRFTEAQVRRFEGKMIEHF